MRAHQQQIDFLRGIAATYVLINHVRGNFYIGGEKLLAGEHSLWDTIAVAALQATALGVEMVILFFVLSGFAMAHSIRHSSSTSRFYAKRIVRIWPPYIAATLFAFAVGALIGAPDIGGRLLGVLFYLQPSTSVTPQFWSLPYEVLFYALCPIILADEKRARWFLAASVACTAATLILKGPLLNPWPSFFLNFLGNEMLLFAIGAMAYHHFDKVPTLSVRRLCAIVAVAFVLTWAIKRAMGDSSLYSSLIVVAVGVLAIKNVPIVKRGNLGFFSYSIYIFHFALVALMMFLFRQMGVEPTTITNPFLWMALVPPILAACYLLYLGTEKPANAMVARIRAAPPGSAGTNLATALRRRA